MRNILVATYGTLRVGFGNYNHYLKNNSNYIGNGKTNEKFAISGGGIPFVSKNHKNTQIIVDVFEIDESTLQALDRLEGHPNWYKRELTTVIVNNEKYECYLYFNEDNYDEKYEIINGDYANKKYKTEFAY